MRLMSLTAALLVAAPAVAFAQEIDLQAAAEEEPPEDANIDRGFLLPTAETQKAGSLTVSNYEFFIAGATYSVTDDTQITAMVSAPFGPFAQFAGMSGKARILDAKPIQLGVQVSGGYFYDEGTGDGSGLFTAGGIASYCLDERCQSLVTGNVTWLSSSNLDSASDLKLGAVLVGASWIQALGPRFKLMLEVIGAMNVDSDVTVSRGVLVNYGFRVSSRRLAADIGFLRPLDLSSDDPVGPGFAPGLPFANFTFKIM